MISRHAEMRHAKLMRQRFNNAMPDFPLPASYPPYAYDILNYLSDQLDLILTGSPEDLLSVIDYVESKFPLFHKQTRLARSGKAWKKHPADAAIVEAVEACFNYSNFSKKDAEWSAYSLVEAMSGRICPYCQLHHINYHMPASKRGFSLRPPLDHFLPKSRYPFLAVSLGNLVPCCSQCNSSVKLAIDPREKSVLHPRSALVVGRIEFSAKGSVPRKIGGVANDVRIVAYSSDPAVERHIHLFKLNERYTWYAREIYDLMCRYDTYLEYPESIQDIVMSSEFTLGFPLDEAEDRALGWCLADVFAELERGDIV